MIDYLAIGHVTEDLWPEGTTPGGTVTYSSRAARALVERVAVLTAASPSTDIQAAFPRIAATCLDAPRTTQFRNIYNRGGRVQVVAPCPVTLKPSQLTDDLRRSKIVHLGPVCNEVSPEFVRSLQPDTFIGITPQGWMRRWDAHGRVTSRASYWTEAPMVLKHASAVVTSIDDVAGDWSTAHHWAAQTRVLIVTQGPLGCTAFCEGHSMHIPAPAVPEVDPTGAGDIFATVLFIALQRGDPLRDACALANCIAAQSVTRLHLSGIPAEADVVLCRDMRLK